MEGFSFLNHPQHAVVRGIIAAGRIGAVARFDGCFSFPMPPADTTLRDPGLGGGTFFDSAVYPLRASTLFLGLPATISCSLLNDSDGLTVRADMLLTYESGARAHVASSFGTSFRSHYSLLGESGFIETERAYAVPPDRAVRVYLEKDDRCTEAVIEPADQFRITVDLFAQELLGRCPAQPHEENLLLQARIMEAALCSSKDGRAISIGDI